MAAHVQLEKECCQLEDVNSIQRNNNTYKGLCNSASTQVSSPFVRAPSFLTGHNEAVSQRVRQDSFFEAPGLGGPLLVEALHLT